ncbi:hypothetical protein ACHAQJ_010130 [Trichoderma viride]
MPSEQRSSDTARQSRDYRSTASTKQVRFPLRRRRVRGQSNGVQKRENASLKQQTLTQMDFISSFGQEITLTDDDASDGDGTACARESLTIPQGDSEAQLAKKPQGETRENTPVIQDSCGSTDGSSDGDVSAETIVSPPRFRPGDVREAAMLPHSVERMESLDTVRDSPRRRAHLSRSLEESGRLTLSPQEDGTSLLAHIHSSARELDDDDREIPDSDEENEEWQLQDDRLVHQETFITGYETQLVLEELASMEYTELGHKDSSTRKLLISTPPHSSALLSSNGAADNEVVFPVEFSQCLPTTILQPPAFSSSPRTRFSSDDQTELNLGLAPKELPNQGQAFESQRVPLHILQSLAPASARTDILLPTSSEVLNLIVDNSEAFLHLPYRVPEQVRRFWLFSHSMLRYMACVQPGKPQNHGWDYQIDQVYQLNNPVEERDMQEEGWINGQVRRYIYLPPAIAGQLLWNLRCATFGNGGLQKEDGHHKRGYNMGISDCQSSSRNFTRGLAIPSQSAAQPENYVGNHDTSQPSSSIFQDHGSSTTTLPANAAFYSSPLLTKSQMLSDSLVSDGL